MRDLIRYGTEYIFYVVMPKLDDTDFAKGADYTYVAGDFKVSKDGGAAANLTTTPTAIAMGSNTALWKITVTSTEAQAKCVDIIVDDAALEQNHWALGTYGHPSALHPSLGIEIASGTLSGTHTTTTADLGSNAPSEVTAGSLLVNRTTQESRLVSSYNSGTGVVTWADALGTAWTNGDVWHIIPGAPSGVATASALSALDTKVDTVDTVVDAIKVATDNLPNSGALTDLVSDVSAILTDTGTSLPATLALIKAVTDVLPDSGALTSLITHLTDIKGASFSGATDSLESIRDRGDAAWVTGGGGAAPTAAENADALLARNIDGGSSTGRSVKEALKRLRNKVVNDSGTLRVYDEDDSTESWHATLSTDASQDPITGVDPT